MSHAFVLAKTSHMQIKKLVKENEVKKLDWDHLVETILESRPRTQVIELILVSYVLCFDLGCTRRMTCP